MSNARLDGKTVFITGGDTGIGYEITKELLRRGARVIIGCQFLASGKDVVKLLSEELPGSFVRAVHINLASLQSVKECADHLLNTEPRIHLLINNAGTFSSMLKITEDNNELIFQVNYLGHFLLTNLLLSRIRESAPARILNVTSTAHFTEGPVQWHDLQAMQHFWGFGSYSCSKLYIILFTLQLQQHLRGSGVVAYSVHPGVTNTDIVRKVSDELELILPYFTKIPYQAAQLALELMLPYLLKTPYQGAQTTLTCALDEALAKQNGLYFSECREQTPSPNAVKREDAAKLWEVSKELVENFLSEVR